jgi:hypothetical protein
LSFPHAWGGVVTSIESIATFEHYLLDVIPAKAGIHSRMEHNAYLLDGFLLSQERQAELYNNAAVITHDSRGMPDFKNQFFKPDHMSDFELY